MKDGRMIVPNRPGTGFSLSNKRALTREIETR